MILLISFFAPVLFGLIHLIAANTAKEKVISFDRFFSQLLISVPMAVASLSSLMLLSEDRFDLSVVTFIGVLSVLFSLIYVLFYFNFEQSLNSNSRNAIFKHRFERCLKNGFFLEEDSKIYLGKTLSLLLQKKQSTESRPF